MHNYGKEKENSLGLPPQFDDLSLATTRVRLADAFSG